MIYGVTGTHRLLTQAQKDLVHSVIKRTVLGPRNIRAKRNKLVSGCAFGVDTEAVMAVWGILPMENLILTVPGAHHNTGLVEMARKAGAHIIEVPPRHTVSETYMARNDVTVEQLGPKGILLAFPWTMVPVVRGSGTWSTVRRANKAGNRVRYYPFEES